MKEELERKIAAVKIVSWQLENIDSIKVIKKRGRY
jgi:hypothetical protein